MLYIYSALYCFLVLIPFPISTHYAREWVVKVSIWLVSLVFQLCSPKFTGIHVNKF